MPLKTLLWIDFALGATTGLAGVIFYQWIERWLQIPLSVVVTVAGITLLYSVLALSLALHYPPAIRWTRSLVMANWFWTVVSIVLLYLYFANASVPGKLFLVLQVMAVAGLAYAEGRALKIEMSKTRNYQAIGISDRK